MIGVKEYKNTGKEVHSHILRSGLNPVPNNSRVTTKRRRVLSAEAAMYIYMCRVCKRISPDHTKRKEGWLHANEVGYSSDAAIINTLCPHCINGGVPSQSTCEPVQAAKESVPASTAVCTGHPGSYQADWTI